MTGSNLKVPVRRMRHLFGLLPSHARCQFCNSPFDGFGAPPMRMIGRGPSRLTSRFCKQCQVTASKFIGGVEIELTLLFADVRGSTNLAEQMSASEFSVLISRFFAVTSRVLLRSHAWVDRLVGDQVVGMYIPYYAGQDHQRVAMGAAKDLLRMTGHTDPAGPWIPLARIHRCGAALGLEQGVRAVGRDGPRSIPINGAGGGLWLELVAPMAVLGSGAGAGSAGQHAREDNRGPGRCDSVGWLSSLVDVSGAVGAVRQAMAGLAIEPGRE